MNINFSDLARTVKARLFYKLVPSPDRVYFFVKQKAVKAGESTKHGPLVHGPLRGPGPWTGVHQNMDRVHGPPFMDRVHGPPYHGPGPWTPYFYK